MLRRVPAHGPRVLETAMPISALAVHPEPTLAIAHTFLAPQACTAKLALALCFPGQRRKAGRRRGTWAFSLSAFKMFGRSTRTWRSMSLLSTTMFVKVSSSVCPEKHNWNTSSRTILRRSAASASCTVGPETCQRVCEHIGHKFLRVHNPGMKVTG